MIVTYKGKKIDLSAPIDLSLPLSNDGEGPNCFYAPYFNAEPLVAGDFVGNTRKGSPVNFYNVKLNPHGNGTHTECVGHIAKERVYINDCLKQVHHLVQVLSVYPTLRDDGDRVIEEVHIEDQISEEVTALIIRTLPNPEDKKRFVYSGTNPPYFSEKAIHIINKSNIKHLLTDLPSLDREEDGGLVLAHKAFWNYPESLNVEKTITEMVYVPDFIKDGLYFLNFQIPSFSLDAAPSRVFLYLLH